VSVVGCVTNMKHQLLDIKKDFHLSHSLRWYVGPLLRILRTVKVAVLSEVAT